MIAPAQGILLIADPFLKDPSFTRKVVLLCRHNNAEGSFGFILNKSLGFRLNELLGGLEPIGWEVFDGGPVQKDTLHYIHQYPALLPDSQPLLPGVAWGGDFNLLKEKIWSGEIEQHKIKFFLGYSGWSSNQLADEIETNSWLTVQADERLVMKTNVEDVWKKSLEKLGGKYKQMIHYPTDPQLN